MTDKTYEELVREKISFKKRYPLVKHEDVERMLTKVLFG